LLFTSSRRNLDFIEPALIRIQDIFTPNPITIQKDADLAEAAKIMIRQGISGIPVIESSLEEEEEELLPLLSIPGHFSIFHPNRSV
jgi:CBS domain-containing protein